MRFDNGAFATPPVVKNLIIINALFFLAEEILPNGLGNVLVERLGLYSWQSPNFHLYQLVTHMFLHVYEYVRFVDVRTYLGIYVRQ